MKNEMVNRSFDALALMKRNGILRVLLPVAVLLCLLTSCGTSRRVTSGTDAVRPPEKKTAYITLEKPVDINRKELVHYARQFLGTPYEYGSSDPEKGFDCSGFVYHVLAHFQVKPPRASYQYKHVGRTMKRKKAKPGDLILFYSPGHSRNISHMGIITEAKDHRIFFIHASSPRSGGVIISELSGYYEKHFAKIIRILR